VPVEEVATTEGRKATCLDLSDKGLTELPAEIAELRELEELNLADNELNELPPEVCQLPELEKLDLSGNEIEELPAEICSLENLEELDLASNRLEEVPPELSELPELEKVDLSDNPIKEAPRTIEPEKPTLAPECPEGQECVEAREDVPRTSQPLSKVPGTIGAIIGVIADCPPEEVLDSLEQELETMRAHEAVYVKQGEICRVCEDVKEWLDEQEPRWEDSVDCGSAEDVGESEPVQSEREPGGESAEESGDTEGADEEVAEGAEPEGAIQGDEEKEDTDEDEARDKVVICHLPPGNPENAHTIEVAPGAVPAHLGHGDYLGPCDCEKESGKKQKRFAVDSLAVREILDKNGLEKVAVDDVVTIGKKARKDKPGAEVKDTKATSEKAKKDKKEEPEKKKPKEEKAKPAASEQEKDTTPAREPEEATGPEERDEETRDCEQQSSTGECAATKDAKNKNKAEASTPGNTAKPRKPGDNDTKPGEEPEKAPARGKEKGERDEDTEQDEKPAHEKRVVGLDLTGRGVADLSPAVGVLDGLEELTLDDNRLTCLPDEVAELEDLEDLSLDNNRIDSLSEVVETFVSSLDSAWKMVQNREVECVMVTVGNWTSGQGHGKNGYWTALADSSTSVSVVIRADKPAAGTATIAREKIKAKNGNGKRIKAADITATEGLEQATSDIEVTMSYSEDELGDIVEDAIGVYVLNRTKTQTFTYVPSAEEVEIHPAYIKEDPAYAGLLREMLQGMAKEVHTAGVWEKVEGTVDTAANTVVFNVSEYETYGLFADSGAATPVVVPTKPHTYTTGVSVNARRGRYSIVFTLAKTRQVRITLCNLEGRLVRDLVSGPYGAGKHRVVWSGKNNRKRPVSPGLYILMMQTAEKRFVRRLRGIW
jgi:hypothetical protein